VGGGVKGGKGREMTQTLYAHMNKIKILKKRFCIGMGFKQFEVSTSSGATSYWSLYSF
jgi:hypothetical protein